MIYTDKNCATCKGLKWVIYMNISRKSNLELISLYYNCNHFLCDVQKLNYRNDDVSPREYTQYRL